MSDTSETIKALFTNPRLYLVTLSTVIILAITGLLKISTPHLKIGKEEIEAQINERAAKRIVFAEQFLSAHKAKMRLEFPNTSQERLDLIFALLEKETLVRIYRNHITNQPNYVYDMTRSFLSIIRTNGTEEKTWSTAFAEYMEKSVRELVEGLVAIQ